MQISHNYTNTDTIEIERRDYIVLYNTFWLPSTMLRLVLLTCTITTITVTSFPITPTTKWYVYMVSLHPQKTYHQNLYGIRNDLTVHDAF